MGGKKKGSLTKELKALKKRRKEVRAQKALEEWREVNNAQMERAHEAMREKFGFVPGWMDWCKAKQAFLILQEARGIEHFKATDLWDGLPQSEKGAWLKLSHALRK